MYEYLWGHTAAQIEMMACDQPFTAYKRTREETGAEKAKRMEDTVEKWKKRKAEREKQGFDLNNFLATGQKVSVQQ